MGHVVPETRSICQILEKPCVCSSGHIFSPMVIKLGENVYLNDSLEEVENVIFLIIKRSLVQILEKEMYVLEAFFFCQYS